jgi:hypothetical protein
MLHSDTVAGNTRQHPIHTHTHTTHRETDRQTDRHTKHTHTHTHTLSLKIWESWHLFLDRRASWLFTFCQRNKNKTTKHLREPADAPAKS